MPTAAYEPWKTVEHAPGTSPKRSVSIGETMTACVLVTPSTGTYGNGVALAAANHGDSQADEAFVEQIEIPEIHPRSSTVYDKTTNFTAGDPAEAIKHVKNKVYWLKGSSLTAYKNKSKLIVAGSGLVKVQLTHTATPLPVHMWGCYLSVSAATYTLGEYLGIVSTFTAV